MGSFFGSNFGATVKIKNFLGAINDGYHIGYVPFFFYRIMLYPDTLNEEVSFCTTGELKEISKYVVNKKLKIRINEEIWEKVKTGMRRSIIYNEIVTAYTFVREFFGYLWFRIFNRVRTNI